MTSRSSFLPRLGFGRTDNNPLLPLHSLSSSVRKKPSEYNLAELSPRPDDGSNKTRMSPPPVRRRSPPPPSSTRGRDESTSHRSHLASSRPHRDRDFDQPILFAGPPPPIATSRMLYLDEEATESTSSRGGGGLGASLFTQNLGSVLFNRGSGASSPSVPRDNKDYYHDYTLDATWLTFQRRERALQEDLQQMLDAQSAGLAANLDPNNPTLNPSFNSNASSTSPAPPSRSSVVSDRSTPRTPPSSGNRARHVTFDPVPHTAMDLGTILPVRQPKPKAITLRAARAGLTRTIGLLADLKADEDAQIVTALGERKKALARLRGLSARREGIVEKLRVLEQDDEEGKEGEGEGKGEGVGWGRELKELVTEQEAVTSEIKNLEARLAELKKRKAWLDARVEEVRSRREAGLSGYRGALREVEDKIGGLLSRPGVKPLDLRVVKAWGFGEEGVWEDPGGADFLKLRPERRTVQMAREWWEGEVAILERRKQDVDRERAALEEGVEVWKEAVKLVTDFEDGLMREMKGEEEGRPFGEDDRFGNQQRSSKGKGKASPSGGIAGTSELSSPSLAPARSPEQAMRNQLAKIHTVMAGLEERLHVAEEKGWKLLICAIGAELEAFRQAEGLLRDALRAAGFDDDSPDGDGGPDEGNDGREVPGIGSTRSSRPPTAIRSSSAQLLAGLESGPGVSTAVEGNDAGIKRGKNGSLADVAVETAGRDDKAAESDNEVPHDLLVSAVEEPSMASEASENEVPIEFLRVHGDYGGLGIRDS